MTRTVTIADPLARANVQTALSGAGAPIGVLEVVADGPVLRVRFDDAISAAELVDDLVAIESLFVPARGAIDAHDEAAALIAAAGLDDPELAAARIIETHLEGRPR